MMDLDENAWLVELWPRIPRGRCTTCGASGPCTWSLAPIRLLCDGCLPSLNIQNGGHA